MTLVQDAVTVLHELTDEVKGLHTGQVPSVWKLLSIQGRILDLYTRLGEEQSFLFSAKEKSYLARKVAAAEQHRKGRLELKLTSKDAEQAALLAVGEEMNAEIESMATWEATRTLRDSLDHAFQYITYVTSAIKWSEQKPSTQQP